MDKKTRFLIFLAAGVIVVISCFLIVAALLSYRRVETIGRQLTEQASMTDTMDEDVSMPPEDMLLP